MRTLDSAYEVSDRITLTLTTSSQPHNEDLTTTADTLTMSDALCREVLETARAMVVAQRLATGEDTQYRQGPDGHWWKFRMYQNGRGYLHLNVTTPAVQGNMYSIDAIERVLVTQYGWNRGDDDDANMEENGEDHHDHLDHHATAPVDVSDEFLNLCAHRVQTAYRAHRMWGTRTLQLRMQHQLSIVMQQIQVLNAAMPQRESAFEMSALSEVVRMESHTGQLIVPHPPLYVVNIPVRPGVMNVLTLMHGPTELERDAVRAHAIGLATEWDARTVPHKCARAVLSGTPYPLLIGSLPLPSVPVLKWKSSATDVALYVRNGNTLHDDHRTLLKNTFKDKFVHHVLHMIAVRTVGIFDFYVDRRMTQHVGSLIVSKFIARLRGNVIPVLHIESIASVTKGQGAGRCMFDFCKSLVLSDNATYGLLLAECLKIDFWQYRMNETTEAQAMIVQLQMLYDDVAFEPLCTMRTREVRDVDESLPSPVKRLA